MFNLLPKFDIFHFNFLVASFTASHNYTKSLTYMNSVVLETHRYSALAASWHRATVTDLHTWPLSPAILLTFLTALNSSLHKSEVKPSAALTQHHWVVLRGSVSGRRQLMGFTARMLNLWTWICFYLWHLSLHRLCVWLCFTCCFDIISAPSERCGSLFFPLCVWTSDNMKTMGSGRLWKWTFDCPPS